MRRTVTALMLTGALALPLAGTASAGAAPLVLAPNDTGTLSTVSAGAAVTTAEANARIGSVLATRTVSKVLGSNFTATVWDTATQRYVYSKRASESLRAASTTKILTAVGVLATAGPTHKMPTTVRAGASADEVVLVAGGDPLLTSKNLRTLAKRTVLGLAESDSDTDSAQPTPSVADAVASLSGRTILVTADDTLFGGSGISRGWPSSYVPTEVRRVRAFARDDNKALDATADAGKYFTSALRALGVTAKYRGTAAADDKAATVATYAGHTVAAAVSHMLLISENDTAEMLLRQVAVAREARATWPGARKALKSTLNELDVPLDGVRIVDGSGLSLDGRLTAPALTAALALAVSDEHPELAGLRGWLPVAGRTGTLQAAYLRFTTKPSKCAAGLIQAKTGTVADAISLAGYAQGADGRTKIFVTIVNSRPTKYTRLTTRKYVDRVASSITGCW